MAVVSLGVSCFATYRIPPIASLVRDSERFAFFLPVTRIWEFVAGAALAFGVERCATWERRVRVALSISGAAFILGAALVFDDLTPFPGFLAVIPVLGTVAMIAGGTSGGGPVRLLGSRPMVWIGDRSYGWYLWHWPLIVFVRTSAPARFGLPVVAAVVALGLAEVSHRFVEQPFRLDTRLGGRRVVALALACVGAPVVFASMVWGGANANWGVDRPAEWSDDRLGVVKKCGDLPNVRWNEACRFRVDGSRGVIILLGDSQAASLSDGFVAATNSMGYDAVVWFESGCPMLVGRTATDDQRLSVNRRCGIWQRKAIALVDRFDPSLAVVSNLSTRYTYPPVPDGDLWRTIAGADGRPTRDADDALKAWGEGFSALLAQFDRRSVSTVVVSPVPEYPRSFDERGLWFLRRPFEPPEITREYLDLRRSPTLDLEASIVASHPTAQVLDPAWALCTESRCRPVDDEGWLYMDNYHLNPRGSRLLEPGLVDAFQKALSNG